MALGHASARQARKSLAFTTALTLAFLPAPADASVLKWLGWDVSKEKVWKDVQYYVDEFSGVVGDIVGTVDPPVGAIIKTIPTLMRIIDPPAVTLLSGRVTVQLSPNETFYRAGWYGEFGSDPTLPAPTVPTGGLIDHNLLQTSCNALMVSCSTAYDESTRRVVMEFDWGPDGLQPTLNLNSDGHFNFAAIYTFSDSGDVPFGRVGSLKDVIANGTNASTYLLCDSGRCGTVPEPSTWALLIVGFGVVGFASRRRARLSA